MLVSDDLSTSSYTNVKQIKGSWTDRLIIIIPCAGISTGSYIYKCKMEVKHAHCCTARRHPFLVLVSNNLSPPLNLINYIIMSLLLISW